MKLAIRLLIVLLLLVHVTFGQPRVANKVEIPWRATTPAACNQALRTQFLMVNYVTSELLQCAGGTYSSVGGGGGSFNINSLTAETSIASGDLIAIYDVSASAQRKITRSNLLAGITSFDINGLTEETTIAGGDFVAIYDVSAGALRKMTRTNLVSGLGGGASSPLTLTAALATDVPLTIDGAAAHSANLQTWKVNGTLKSYIDNGGGVNTPVIASMAGNALSIYGYLGMRIDAYNSPMVFYYNGSPKGQFDSVGFQMVQSTPASSAATCTAGNINVDASYIYVCTATNTWKRVALSAF